MGGVCRGGKETVYAADGTLALSVRPPVTDPSEARVSRRPLAGLRPQRSDQQICSPAGMVEGDWIISIIWIGCCSSASAVATHFVFYSTLG
jgi:hypothetical protein